MLSADLSQRLCSAFPAAMGSDVSAALLHVPPSGLALSVDNIGPVQVAAEQLHIPYRLYAAEIDATDWKALSSRQRLILTALYTRHHDGFVRQKYVTQLIQAEEEWVPPFVIQLLGEYVWEIGQVLELHLENLSREPYDQFLKQNEPFVSLVCERLVSYWDCYYRTRFPRIEEYPAFRVVSTLTRNVLGSLRDATEQTLAPDSLERGDYRRVKRTLDRMGRNAGARRPR